MDKSTSHLDFCQFDVSPLIQISNGEAALSLAENGFYVFPLHYPKNHVCSCLKSTCKHPAKHPLTFHGYKDATRNINQIKDWWKQHPLANIGIATGIKSQLVVLDIDVKSGGLNSLKELEVKVGKIRSGVEAKSGGGGLHFYFAHPGEEIKTKISILPGIDIIAEKASIVAPPSRHISGNRYEWIRFQNLSEMPEWLVDLICDHHKKPSNNRKPIGEGYRNSTLTSFAGFLKAKGFANEDIKKSLESLNITMCNPPLDETEVGNISQNIGKYPTLEWAEVKSIPIHAQAKELKKDDLPLLLRDWIADISERMQVPLDFVAVPALIAASTLIGRKLAVRPLKHDDWTVIPNLWGFLVAEPGSKKSAAIDAAFGPLNKIEKREHKKHENACEEKRRRILEIEHTINNLKINIRQEAKSHLGSFDPQNKILSLEQSLQEEKKELKQKRYRVNDSTVEKLLLILKDNPQGILLFRDEIYGWIESLHKIGREGSKEFYLESWNGNSSFITDRVSRGTAYAEFICLSIFGGIQPAKLHAYVDKHSTAQGDDGFLSRFQLAVFPEQSIPDELVDRVPNVSAFEAALACYEFLDGLEINDDSPICLRFSPDAQPLADEWRRELELKIILEKANPLLKAHLGKYRSLLPSLGLIFCIINAGTKKHIPQYIDINSLTLAINWCSYLESHIRKIFKETNHDPYTHAKLLADRILKKQVLDGDSVRSICRKQWKNLHTGQKVNNAIEALSALNWIQLQTIKGRGGSSEVIRINPELLKGGVE